MTRFRVYRVYRVYRARSSVAADSGPSRSAKRTIVVAMKAARTTRFVDISVVGHSDSVGNDDTNLVLSMYRAQTIRTALVSGGVSPSAIDVGYHGSNNPRVPRPSGVPEPENRRVEVTIR